MTDDKKTIDLSMLIDQHKREIFEFKKKESEWIRVQNLLIYLIIFQTIVH